MVRGLLWLPLLAVFIWLAWAGWNEYKKLEAYRVWAEQFERAKYDIYSVLGQQGSELTWGKPTRHGPVLVQTFSLLQVRSIQLIVNGQATDLTSLTSLTSKESGDRTIALAFELPNTTVQIPFTERALAVQWGQFLQVYWQSLSLESQP